MIPAPISAAPPNTQGRQPSPVAKATSMMPSLLQNPENGGMPRMASQPQPKVTQVIFMAPETLPNRRMSTESSMPCMTDPAPRNIPALKKPWVSRCRIANT